MINLGHQPHNCCSELVEIWEHPECSLGSLCTHCPRPNCECSSNCWRSMRSSIAMDHDGSSTLCSFHQSIHEICKLPIQHSALEKSSLGCHQAYTKMMPQSQSSRPASQFPGSCTLHRSTLQNLHTVLAPQETKMNDAAVAIKSSCFSFPWQLHTAPKYSSKSAYDAGAPENQMNISQLVGGGYPKSSCWVSHFTSDYLFWR